MDNDSPKRNNKGQFVKGISGNPTGKTKEGLIPQQDHPIQDAKELRDFIENQRASVEYILLQNAPELMRIACEQAKTDPRVMKELLPCIAPDFRKYDQHDNAKKTIPRRDQLEMEFLRELEQDGRDVKNILSKQANNDEEENE